MWRMYLKLTLLVQLYLAEAGLNHTSHKEKRVLSLFSVVQFPNNVCTTQLSSSIYGTCRTNSECTSAGGTASGNCAAGFGVCCYLYTSTCSSTITANNTYITNPTYPSSYSPTSTGSCSFTISKVSSDVCQLRLDFQTFSGLTVSTGGVCSDTFTVTGKTGTSPPTICGTNTGYHMYVEVGKASSDTATVTVTYGTTTPAKQFNVFVQQIECTSTSRAPTDCVQYYTGRGGNIQSYGWAGGQLLLGMDYEICIRDEKGYCGISYVEASGTTIDAFNIYGPTTATFPGTIGAVSNTGACAAAGLVLLIPRTSSDGRVGFSQQGATTPGLSPFPNAFCGANFGVQGTTSSNKLTTIQRPFAMHLLTSPSATINSPSTGFSLNYEQIPC